MPWECNFAENPFETPPTVKKNQEDDFIGSVTMLLEEPQGEVGKALPQDNSPPFHVSDIWGKFRADAFGT